VKSPFDQERSQSTTRSDDTVSSLKGATGVGRRRKRKGKNETRNKHNGKLKSSANGARPQFVRGSFRQKTGKISKGNLSNLRVG